MAIVYAIGALVVGVAVPGIVAWAISSTPWYQAKVAQFAGK